MKLCDIHIRDPFILLHDGRYYLYGTKFNGEKGTYPQISDGTDVYVSDDLENFSQPIPVFRRDENFWATHYYWAPEVHKYGNRFYMFITVAKSGGHKGVISLCCDTPDGTFVPCSSGFLTPSDWECLDGTLFVENGKPYMIFCHEWTQISDGEMCIVALSDDLSKAIGEPEILFRASEPTWATGFSSDALAQGKAYVTDGPFIYKTEGKRLIMIWSSLACGKYVEAVSYSDSGISGPWKHFDELLFENDGGHGMLFRDKSDNLLFTMHYPNTCDLERPVIVKVKEKNARLIIE